MSIARPRVIAIDMGSVIGVELARLAAQGAPLSHTQVISKRMPISLVGLLALGHCATFADRNLPAVAAPLLKSSLGLTDSQLGVLDGPAFALLYALGMLASWPLARSPHRLRLIAVCIAVWTAGMVIFALGPDMAGVVSDGLGVDGPGLSIALYQDIIDSNGMSRAGLYRLFEPQGGVAHYIQMCRLQQLRARLDDRAFDNQSLAELAPKLGFSGESHAGRLFKQAFGVSPGAYRTASIRVVQSPPVEMMTRRWDSSLHELR